MIGLKDLKESFAHLLFPHICAGCGTDIVSPESSLCFRCLAGLPETGFEMHADNPAEKIFRGRLKIISGTAQYYFTKESLVQRLMHQLKYKGHRELGKQWGRLMGDSLKKSKRFDVDALIPLPLFPAKEKKRGYNQAAVICEGMKESMNIPVLYDVVTRPQFTETQTKKGRIERWENIEGKFDLVHPEAICGKHILLVDDVITTGATLEACGTELLKGENVRLSIATLCIASR